MKLTKVLVSIAAVAIVTEVTRRIVTEINERKIDAELDALFADDWEDYYMAQYKPKHESPKQKAERERKEKRKALLAEQDYLLASLSDALSTQDTETIAKDKARLTEINTELEAK